MDELSLRDPRTYGLDATTAQIELAQFGSKPVQDLVRAGLRDIPALKWQYLVTVHVVLGPGNTWFEVDGATLIDLPTAKSMYDRGALFLDSSGKSAWETSHVPGAVHLSWERNADPRYSRAALREVAGYDDEIVFYGSDGLLTGAWEAAKAVTWGYHNVSFFHGGVQAWKDAGYPVELGP